MDNKKIIDALVEAYNDVGSPNRVSYRFVNITRVGRSIIATVRAPLDRGLYGQMAKAFERKLPGVYETSVEAGSGDNILVRFKYSGSNLASDLVDRINNALSGGEFANLRQILNDYVDSYGGRIYDWRNQSGGNILIEFSAPRASLGQLERELRKEFSVGGALAKFIFLRKEGSSYLLKLQES